MIILSHRGYWTEPSEKNQRSAFARSFELGFGTETDVRDCNQEIVISHDMPHGTELRLRDVVDIMAGRDLPLALNIKSDGIGPLVRQQLDQAGLANWFTFDMSIPDMVHQLRHGLPAFTRVSDIERTPVLYERATGIWLDAFHSDWYEPELIASYVRDNKRVCIVSPELHGRDHAPQWSKLRACKIDSSGCIMLCTDRPEEARAFFGSGGTR